MTNAVMPCDFRKWQIFSSWHCTRGIVYSILSQIVMGYWTGNLDLQSFTDILLTTDFVWPLIKTHTSVQCKVVDILRNSLFSQIL